MAKNEAKKGFCVFFDWVDSMDFLSGDQVKEAMKALNAYYRDGTNPVDAVGDELKAWMFNIYQQILRGEEISAKRAENARAVNEKKKTVCEDLRAQCSAKRTQTSTERTQCSATDTDTITDTDTVINTPPTPSKGGEVCAKRFAEFWDAYPRKEGKERAKQAFKKLGPDEDLLQRMLDAIELQKASDQWQREDGKYIPHPATWLNGKRWEDEVKPASSGNMFADYLAEMRGGGGTIFV